MRVSKSGSIVHGLVLPVSVFREDQRHGRADRVRYLFFIWVGYCHRFLGTAERLVCRLGLFLLYGGLRHHDSFLYRYRTILMLASGEPTGGKVSVQKPNSIFTVVSKLERLD